VAYSNSWVNNTPNTNLDVVTSPSAHDVLIAFAKCDTASQAFTWPAGFSIIGTAQDTTADGQTTAIAIKNDATGSEGTLRISCAVNCVGGIIAYSGRNNSSPQAFTASQTNNNTGTASPWTIDSNSVTPSGDGVDLFAFMSDDVQLFQPDVAHTIATISGSTGSWTNRQDPSSNSSYDYCVASATQTSAGAITVRGTGTSAGDQAGRCLFLVGLLSSVPPASVQGADPGAPYGMTVGSYGGGGRAF
jgi:hypothetical protein